jgi:hypothetical protein
MTREDYTMHAIPNNTGPRMTLTCFTFMPVAALRAEAEGFGAPAVDDAAAGAPRVEVGPVGKTRVAVAVLEPMKPPDGEGEVLFVTEFDEPGFLLTSWKLAQAMRVLLA